ncbi:hypothetical protein [Macrococcus bovicus]|uniref:hypothetical protein n=1 Tax=Macrococcus bovicus TaxID=69968 RepID=UPI0025A5EB60|nr:hypothetical protein [Macrococcus bovicus]WJP97401.1 hypothetical protein QSV55_09000 [Macrococcus bovicus]
MNKFVISTLATTILLAGSGVGQSEAATVKNTTIIGYAGKDQAKKILNGYLKFDGMSVGDTVSKFSYNNNYITDQDTRIMTTKDELEGGIGIADYQDNVAPNKQKITRIIDLNPSKDYSRNNLLNKKLYGKPLKTFGPKECGNSDIYVDFYKNVTLFYKRDYNKVTTLQGAVFFKNPSTKSQLKWQDYVRYNAECSIMWTRDVIDKYTWNSL